MGAAKDVRGAGTLESKTVDASEKGTLNLNCGVSEYPRNVKRAVI
jgi:hypothetical protein